MKTYLDCFPCMLRQALEAARMAEADAGQQRAVLNRVMELFFLLQVKCPVLGREVGAEVGSIILKQG